MSAARFLKVLAPLSSGAIVVYLIARVSSSGDDPSREALRQIAERDAERLKEEAGRAKEPASDKPAGMTEADFIDLEIMHGFLGGTKAAPPGAAYKEYIAREYERQEALHKQSGNQEKFYFSQGVAFDNWNAERIERQQKKGILITPVRRPPDDLDRVLGTEFLYGTKAPAGGMFRATQEASEPKLKAKPRKKHKQAEGINLLYLPEAQ